MIQNILLAFIPIFVAVDALGVLPIFVSLTHHLDKKHKQKIILQSLITALCLAISFIIVGKAIFRFLGITVADFMTAGGVVLLCIALNDLLTSGKRRRESAEELGAVPIGTPLIVGPAVLTTSLILIDQYGVFPTLVAVFVNVLLAGFIFSQANLLIKVLGQAGSRALSKVMALLLAAIAVMMIRKGIFQMLGLQLG
jgi:multiple antibiotic resistance protein